MPTLDLTFLIDYISISSAINNRLIDEATGCTGNLKTADLFSLVNTCNPIISKCSTGVFSGVEYKSPWNFYKDGKLLVIKQTCPMTLGTIVPIPNYYQFAL